MASIENLIDELAKDAGPVKPAAHPLRLSGKWMAGAAAYLAVALLISGLRGDWLQKMHQPWFVAELASLAVLFVSASISAALLAFPDLHQRSRVALLPLPAFAALLTVLCLAWVADSPAAPLPRHSFECTLSIMLMAVLPAMLMLGRMRKLASTHGKLAGGSAMLAAFSVGALWLRLYELNDSIRHVIEWHYLPMLAFSAAGLWLGKRWLRW